MQGCIKGYATMLCELLMFLTGETTCFERNLSLPLLFYVCIFLPKVPNSSLRSNYSDDQGWYNLNELFVQNSHTLMYSYYMDGVF